MRFVTKLGAAGLAGASALLLAVVPAQASTAGHGGHGGRVSGPEVLFGSVRGPAAISNSPVVPLTLRGLVNTFGAVSLGGPQNATNHTVFTFAGQIFVVTDNSTATQNSFVNPRNCFAVSTERESFQVVGGTRVFWGAYGPGQVRITSGAFVPRFRSGRCNVKAGPVSPQGAFIRFFASITPLTIRFHHHR
ncbi:MAG: hypothetical protein ACRDPO_13530 [Streptosporangiaceae bacterium]